MSFYSNICYELEIIKISSVFVIREGWTLYASSQTTLLENSMRRAYIQELKKKLSKGHDILGRDQYVNSAVLVPLLVVGGEQHILFEKRAAHIKQGNEICFPGGHFDRNRDTSYLETALRETREELGIDPDTVEILGQLDTLVAPRGIIVESYLGCVEINDLDDLQLDRAEVEKVFTVPVSWFRKNPPEIYHTRVEVQASYRDRLGEEHILLPVEELGLPSIYKKNRNDWQPKVIVYRREPEIIWGFTAAIVYNLISKFLEDC